MPNWIAGLDVEPLHLDKWIDGMSVEPLHWRHIREFIAAAGPDSHFVSSFKGWTDARFHFTPMIGHTFREAKTGQALGLGGVLWVGRVEAHAFFAMTPEFAADVRRSRWVHRPSLLVLAMAHRHSDTIYSWPDPAIPAAARWLRRLGFEPPAPDSGTEYWTHAIPSAPGPDDCNSRLGGGRLHHGQRDPACAIGGCGGAGDEGPVRSGAGAS
jgi:hypothetical protein